MAKIYRSLSIWASTLLIGSTFVSAAALLSASMSRAQQPPSDDPPPKEQRKVGPRATVPDSEADPNLPKKNVPVVPQPDRQPGQVPPGRDRALTRPDEPKKDVPPAGATQPPSRLPGQAAPQGATPPAPPGQAQPVPGQKEPGRDRALTRPDEPKKDVPPAGGTQPPSRLPGQAVPQGATPPAPPGQAQPVPGQKEPGQTGAPAQELEPSVPSASGQPERPPSGASQQQNKGTDGAAKGPTAASPTTSEIAKVAPAVPGPQKLEEVKQGRRERVESEDRRIIEEPGNRVIIKQDNRVVIRHNETIRIQNFAPNAVSTRKSEGVTETVFARPDGARVFTEADDNGRVLRRYRRDPAGREIVLIDNRRFYRDGAIGVGVGALGVGIALALTRPNVSLPREKYIVEYDRASDDEVYEALSAPPVARLEREYSLEEIRYSEPLREHMRRIDLDTINFEFGSFEVTQDQYPRLERVAGAIDRTLRTNPAEVFLIEGHTDAIGSDEDNLSLSDRRAEAVARSLITHFNVPLENIVTQGYGKQFLKVNTQEAERANRRVAIRRITPLLGQARPQ